jgi:ribosome-binding ATPase
MNVGIVGLPGAGKEVVFNAIAQGGGYEDHGAHIVVVRVPDERFNWLAAHVQSKKATPATIEFVLGAARIGDKNRREKFGSDFFADVRKVEALLHVVRVSQDELGTPPTPVEDARELSEELILADLQVVETRLARIEKSLHGVKQGAVIPETIERDLLLRVRKLLEEGDRIDTGEFTTEEERILKGFDFLTLKPQVLVANVAEADLGKETEALTVLRQHAGENNLSLIVICAELEVQIGEIPEEDRTEYMSAMGLDEPASFKLIRECYKRLGAITFFTIGEPEVRAWTIPAVMHVVDAAGKIHSDIARGFIRAEVASFDTVRSAGGWDEAKRQGLVHLHTKEYVVQDGDIIFIRFKV